MPQVCHRDLKLENTLLDGSPAPRLKICDFGYSKVFIFNVYASSLSISILRTLRVHVKYREMEVELIFLSQVLEWGIKLGCKEFIIFNIALIVIFSLQSSLLHSQPKSTIGTLAYIGPEVLSKNEYDGRVRELIQHV